MVILNYVMNINKKIGISFDFMTCVTDYELLEML
jgi:hypothetical protein